MHSSRIRTAGSVSYGGLPDRDSPGQRPPDRDPMVKDPPDRDPLDRDSPGERPPGQRPIPDRDLPPHEQNDTQVKKHYLPANSFAGGNYD